MIGPTDLLQHYISYLILTTNFKVQILVFKMCMAAATFHIIGHTHISWPSQVNLEYLGPVAYRGRGVWGVQTPPPSEIPKF